MVSVILVYSPIVGVNRLHITQGGLFSWMGAVKQAEDCGKVHGINTAGDILVLTVNGWPVILFLPLKERFLEEDEVIDLLMSGEST